jgi:hypothetical protein
MTTNPHLIQAALDEYEARSARLRAVSDAITRGNTRARVEDVITIDGGDDIAIVSYLLGGRRQTFYVVVIAQTAASQRYHASLDLALLHLVEIRNAERPTGLGEAYKYAARVLNVPNQEG